MSALISLLWLASPVLPVGDFSYSEGLEAAIDPGLIGNEAQAGDWLLDQLELGLGFPMPTSCSSRAAATTWPRPSAPNSQT